MREATTERQRPDDNTVYTGPPESAAQAHFQVVAIGLGALMAALTQTLLVPVLPKLAVELHTTARTAQWLLTSTLLVAAVSVPIIGRLADGIGLGSSSVPEGNQGDTRLMDRAQLANFLRTRREALQPEDVGLPRGQRRRTGGLRREEVAALRACPPTTTADAAAGGRDRDTSVGSDPVHSPLRAVDA